MKKRKNHSPEFKAKVALEATRSHLYYEPKGESAENLRFMEIIDEQFLETS